MTNGVTVSLILAADSDCRRLRKLLESLSSGWLPSDMTVESIVIDNGRLNDPQAAMLLCDAHNAVRLEAPTTVSTYNACALRARGEWLLFVDAAADIGPDILCAFAEAAAAPRPMEEKYARPLMATTPSMASRLLPSAENELLFLRRDTVVTVGGLNEASAPGLETSLIDLYLRMQDGAEHARSAIRLARSLGLASRERLAPLQAFQRGLRDAWLLREHRALRRLSPPGLAVFFSASLVAAAASLLVGSRHLILVPVVFLMLAALLGMTVHAVIDRRPMAAITRMIRELALGLGRLVGAIAFGSFAGITGRIDADDETMSDCFPELVFGLWRDLTAVLLTVIVFLAVGI